MSKINRHIDPTVPHRVLVAPLDWGLGHATRMIPVVRALEQAGAEVFLAAEGRIRTLLGLEFPHLPMLSLEGYDISYSKHPFFLPIHLLKQMPALLKKIKQENEWLHRMQDQYQFSAVISDNRYGLYHSQLKSIFITHQLRIKAPGLMEDILQMMHYKYIEKFDECWIPDAAGDENLSGSLAHPKKLPAMPVKYLGPLSRFKKSGEQKTQHLLILLSGPEPQRTLLEDQMLDELEHYTEPVVLVRGLPGRADKLTINDNIKVYDHLPAQELERLMEQASFIISRSGYSTVMDLAHHQKKSILIPTPGQTEQEYLGKHLVEKKIALCLQQKKFRLRPALDLAAHFPYIFPPFKSDQLMPAVEKFLRTLPPPPGR